MSDTTTIATLFRDIAAMGGDKAFASQYHYIETFIILANQGLGEFERIMWMAECLNHEYFGNVIEGAQHDITPRIARDCKIIASILDGLSGSAWQTNLYSVAAANIDYQGTLQEITDMLQQQHAIA